jgi:acetyl-CoA carboxylase biotin carboxyl carrier protein
LAHGNLTYDDLLRIVELIKSTEHFSEFRLKVGDIELELRHRKSGAPTAASPNLKAVAAQSSVTNRAERAQPATSAEWPEGSVAIRSPMVGTFYRAPQPGAPPFVEVGQAVKRHSVVGIIEVMKLMNSITADVNGIVEEILVDDAAPVEAGQPVIVIRPNLTTGAGHRNE